MIFKEKIEEIKKLVNDNTKGVTVLDGTIVMSRNDEVIDKELRKILEEIYDAGYDDNEGLGEDDPESRRIPYEDLD